VATDPIGWPSLQVHDCQDSNSARSDGVEVREAMKKAPPDPTLDYRASLGMLFDRTLAFFNLVQERDPQARGFELIVLGGLVQLAFRELMKACPNHLLQLGSSGTEHG
jgi:hypothetical protein